MLYCSCHAMQMKEFSLISVESFLSGRILFFAMTKRQFKITLKISVTQVHTSALCLFTSSRGHTLHLHIPASHTDLMQTITMEELLISPGWNTDISCYPLPRQMLIAVVVSCVRCQKPANKTSTIAFYTRPHLVTNSV